MIIDHPRREELRQLGHIWKEAFGDTDAFLEGFYHKGFSASRCRCVYLDGTPVSVLYWFDCAWEGKRIAYLYAVATDKAYRGRHLAGALLEDTHRHLKALGYAGAILVPGSESLFAFYAPYGYKPCCPMEEKTVAAAQAPARLRRITPEDFEALREGLLPAGGVSQTGAAYLATYAGLYAGEGWLLAATREEETLLIHEYLGKEALLPAIIRALDAKKGILRSPGGSVDTAMYCSLDGGEKVPSYFGLTLG